MRIPYRDLVDIDKDGLKKVKLLLDYGTDPFIKNQGEGNLLWIFVKALDIDIMMIGLTTVKR